MMKNDETVACRTTKTSDRLLSVICDYMIFATTCTMFYSRKEDENKYFSDRPGPQALQTSTWILMKVLKSPCVHQRRWSMRVHRRSSLTHPLYFSPLSHNHDEIRKLVVTSPLQFCPMQRLSVRPRPMTTSKLTKKHYKVSFSHRPVSSSRSGSPNR